MDNSKILVVDDEANALRVYSAIIQEDGHQVLTAQSGKEAQHIIQREDDLALVITDLKMPETDGLKLFKWIQKNYTHLPVIILTAYGSIESAVQALKQGAYYYFTKPPDFEQMRIMIKKCLEEQNLKKEIYILRKELEKKYSFSNIIGKSKKTHEIFELIKTIACSNSTVLIEGESGTGKELVAKAIHFHSNRKNKPFIVINCGALPSTLLESELFGHEKGAFTGAIDQRKGRFELADQGTIFFDEIGECPPELQLKLLRVLQEREFERVGGANKTIKIDVRLIAATNCHLQNEVKKGNFREDLFFRLNVINVPLPPLRERSEDIPLLATHFLQKYSQQERKPIKSISPEAMKILMNYDWPGNIRELENIIERGVVIGQRDILTPLELPKNLEIKKEEQPSPLIKELTENGIKLANMEKELITKTLEKVNGNKSKAAKLLGITRKKIYTKISEYKIR